MRYSSGDDLIGGGVFKNDEDEDEDEIEGCDDTGCEKEEEEEGPAARGTGVVVLGMATSNFVRLVVRGGMARRGDGFIDCVVMGRRPSPSPSPATRGWSC